MTNTSFLRFTVCAAAFSLTTLTGCKSTPATVDDTTLTNTVASALKNDASIANEPIQPTVQNGSVTLNGNVSNDTARQVAAQDAAKVAGVKQVVNDLTVQGAQLAPTITSPAAPASPRVATPQERTVIARHEALPPPSSQSAPPPPPPAPVVRDLTVPAGSGISVRINEALDSGTTQEGTPFTGTLTSPIVIDGELAVPAGSAVSGRVVQAHDAGHFEGNSLLSVQIFGLSRRGERISVSTEPYTLEGKGRGKNSAEKIGGGAAVGAVLGGIFGHGKGAAIGAVAGGGAGAGAQALTRGQQVHIGSEEVVRFRLTSSFTVRSLGAPDQPGTGLQQR